MILAGDSLGAALDAGDVCIGRALVAPGHDLLNGFLVTLEHCLDAAIRQIAHPARHAAGVGLSLSLVTKENALHVAADYDVNPNVGHEGLHKLAGGLPDADGTVAVFGLVGTLANTFVPRSRIAVKGFSLAPRQFKL